MNKLYIKLYLYFAKNAKMTRVMEFTPARPTVDSITDSLPGYHGLKGGG